MSKANRLVVASWIGDNSDDETSAYLALDESILQDIPHPDFLEAVLNKLYIEEELSYLCATDAFATIQIDESGCSVSLSDHENILFSFVVDSGWASLAQSQGCFIWIIVHDELLLEQANTASMQELMHYYQQDSIELISVAVPSSATA